MKAIAMALAVSVAIASVLVISPTASADTTYWVSAAPPSYNATYWTVYPKSSTSEADADEVKVAFDGEALDLYSSTTATKYIKTNDFTDYASWVDAFESEEFEPVGYMPPPDATILAVSVYTLFQTYSPDLKLYFSTNDESTYTASSTFPAGSGPTYKAITWNVTALAAWTTTMLNSTDTWVKMVAYPTTGTHYYLEYLGFMVSWYGDYEGGGTGGGEPEPPDDEGSGGLDLNYSWVYSAGGIIGVMGLAGAIGLMFLPVFAVWTFRRSDEDRISLFVKFLVCGMFCLTLLMLAINQ